MDMRFGSANDLERLIDAEVPESASLEYKESLTLDKQSERLEVLKDLTGMGNGGGGTVLYGVAEAASGDWPAAESLSPLSAALIGRLEDIVRSGVHPPLLAEYGALPVQGGFVLAVDVERSPIGPYVVEAYGHRRYHVRVGTRTVPMTEREVRDAYAIARRAREVRPGVWAEHGLPLPAPNDDPWVVVSALPEEPLVEMFDMRLVTTADLQPPNEMATYINNDAIGDLTPSLRGLSRWLDGYFAVDQERDGTEYRVVRLHRDGAAAIAMRLRPGPDGEVWAIRVVRKVNAALLYLGWLWERFGLRAPIEIDIAVHRRPEHLFERPVSMSRDPEWRVVVQPYGLSVQAIRTTEYVLPWELRRASVRHGLVLRLADRLYQAIGDQQAEVPFRRGLLHDRSGTCINVSVGTDTIWDEAGGGHIGWVYDDDSVWSTYSGEHVAWYSDGVVMDKDGAAIAVLELAPGVGCPEDFIGSHLQGDPGGSARSFVGQRRPPPQRLTAPAPSRRWSAADLRSHFGP